MFADDCDSPSSDNSWGEWAEEEVTPWAIDAGEETHSTETFTISVQDFWAACKRGHLAQTATIYQGLFHSGQLNQNDEAALGAAGIRLALGSNASRYVCEFVVNSRTASIAIVEMGRTKLPPCEIQRFEREIRTRWSLNPLSTVSALASVGAHEAALLILGDLHYGRPNANTVAVLAMAGSRHREFVAEAKRLAKMVKEKSLPYEDTQPGILVSIMLQVAIFRFGDYNVLSDCIDLGLVQRYMLRTYFDEHPPSSADIAAMFEIETQQEFAPRRLSLGPFICGNWLINARRQMRVRIVSYSALPRGIADIVLGYFAVHHRPVSYFVDQTKPKKIPSPY